MAGKSSAEQPSPDGIRLKNGEWRPAHRIEYAPVFAWPPRPVAVLKWLFGYPGYLWPWNIFWVALTALTWFYFQPATEAFAALSAPLTREALRLAGTVWARNAALLWLTAGGWHLVLYTLKLQGTTHKYNPEWLTEGKPSFLFGSQLYDNIFWSTASGVTFWTAYECAYFWALATGRVVAVDWAAHPGYCAAVLFAIPFWRELHFYFIHRALHYKPLYSRIHYLHHLNSNPGPWSGMAMHPLEHLGYFSVLLIHLLVPSHPLHFLFNAQHTALTPAGGHHGFEGPVLDGKVPTGSYFHWLHHRYLDLNYGEATLPLDWLFGTFHDGVTDPRSAKGGKEAGAKAE